MPALIGARCTHNVIVAMSPDQYLIVGSRESSCHPHTALLLVAALATSLNGCISLWGSGNATARRMGSLLEVKPGMRIGEVGAGTGKVTVALAKEVGPDGHIYATEIDPGRLDRIQQNVDKAGVSNVTIIHADADRIGLPENCCDAVFMIGVYHHLTNPVAIDAGIFRAVAPGGELAIADFPPSIWLRPWTPKGIPANRGGHGVSEEIVINEVEAAGFQFSRRVTDWPGGLFLHNYCLLFRKPASDALHAVPQ
jgi:ubiquinone/menaquinone biosynthesis C-methylase UbiE